MGGEIYSSMNIAQREDYRAALNTKVQDECGPSEPINLGTEEYPFWGYEKQPNSNSDCRRAIKNYNRNEMAIESLESQNVDNELIARQTLSF